MYKYLPRKLAAIIKVNILVLLAVIGLLIIFAGIRDYPQAVVADTQFSQRPRDVRIGHLGSDAVAGRKDFVFRLKNSGTPSTITAYAPGGTILFSIPPDPAHR